MHIFDDSIIHPAAYGKSTGQNWPLNETDRQHLLRVLPVLVKTHHAIAYMGSPTHDVNDHLGIRMMEEMEDLVSNYSVNFKNIGHSKDKPIYFQRNYDGADAELEKEYRESADAMKPRSLSFLRSFRFMIQNLKSRSKLDTSSLKCRVCCYKNF